MEDVDVDVVEPDEDLRFHYDMINTLGGIKSQSDADAYIEDVLTGLSVKEKEAIVKTFYNITSKKLVASSEQPAKAKSGGGKRLRVSTKDTHDIRIYRLLELADTCHDFYDDAGSVEKVQALIREHAYMLPNGLSASHVSQAIKFVSFMSSRTTLTFGTDTVANPLYGANIMTSFDITQKYATVMDVYKAQQHSVRSMIGSIHTRSLTPVDVYLMPENTNKSKKMIELTQIVQLLSAMRERFGAHCDFEIDATNEPLLMLICALEYISNAFYKRYTTNPPTADVEELSQKIKETISHYKVQDTSWTQHICDANIFDAVTNDVKLPIDARPTGSIYRSGCKYQVKLGGISTSGPQSIKHVHVSVFDSIPGIPILIHAHTAAESRSSSSSSSGSSSRSSASLLHIVWNKPITNRDTTATNSTANIEDHLRLKANGLNIDPSPKITAKNVKNVQLRDIIGTFSEPLLYALKRAGDWGQIMNCARYGKVFVTCDKLAALYAYYRGVRFMFLRRQEPGINLKHLGELYRHIFVLH